MTIIESVTANKNLCPSCEHEGASALYKIFPMKICTNFQCFNGDVWGFWSWVLQYHFDGEFMVYPKDAGYFKAVYIWMTGQAQEE